MAGYIGRYILMALVSVWLFCNETVSASRNDGEIARSALVFQIAGSNPGMDWSSTVYANITDFTNVSGYGTAEAKSKLRGSFGIGVSRYIPDGNSWWSPRLVYFYQPRTTASYDPASRDDTRISAHRLSLSLLIGRELAGRRFHGYVGFGATVVMLWFHDRHDNLGSSDPFQWRNLLSRRSYGLIGFPLMGAIYPVSPNLGINAELQYQYGGTRKEIAFEKNPYAVYSVSSRFLLTGPAVIIGIIWYP
ncbi:MAG: hypothetical protein ABII79_06615 [bacterium]